jgi:nitrate/nitrite transport system substrate-binding protein
MAVKGGFIGAAKPEKETVRVGFLPLTDCAPLVMASVLGFDEKYGIKIVMSREHSWSGMRDRLTSGSLDAGHVLYGLIYGVQMGIGAGAHKMAVLMNMSQNGQAITLSRALAQAGAVDGPGLAKVMKEHPRRYTFAQTFPTGNHAMWLNYWLAASSINPLRDCAMVTVPPSQMAANLGAGHMDGFCAGEPWGERAAADRFGVTVATSQQIWRDHPGKVLGASAAFVDACPNTARALVAALLDACRWIDASLTNRQATTEVIASPAFVNAGREVIEPRLLGFYDNGFGKRWKDPHCLRFHAHGAANYPYLSDGMWFMTQHRRWGLLKSDPDYLAVATEVNRIALYREASEMAGVASPRATLRSSTLMDGRVWDGTDPVAYAASFDVSALD